MTYEEKMKILGTLRTAKADVDETYEWNIASTILRMTKDGFSGEEIDRIAEYLRQEKADVLEALETRITNFKLANELYTPGN